MLIGAASDSDEDAGSNASGSEESGGDKGTQESAPQTSKKRLTIISDDEADEEAEGKVQFTGPKIFSYFLSPIDLSQRAECRKIIFRARKDILTEIQGSKSLKQQGGPLSTFCKKKFFLTNHIFMG